MKFGYCFLSVVPLRKSASDTSQMVSQLLFGDVVEVLDQVAENWILVKNAFDHYEGYMDPKQLLEIDSIDFVSLKSVAYTNQSSGMIETSLGTYILPAACSFPGLDFKVGALSFKYTARLYSREEVKTSKVPELAKSFLNAPYLWGGKSSFGLDCSGFTQSVFKMAGLQLHRDAAQQATQGELLNFIEEAQAGDLAFFDNEEGDIIHVGIIIAPNEIIHASGRVRIDQLDHQGIFNKEMGKYTHNLRLIKRYL
jgi:cell wall-associated NlpC family hydrolase